MTKIDAYKQMIEDTKQFGREAGVLKLKMETVHFDFVFELGEDGEFALTSTKAVIRTLGKVTKVKLEGDDTYEAAYERTRRYWSEYFKRYRDKAMTPEQRERTKTKSRVRAKRYRSNKKAEERAFLERG